MITKRVLWGLIALTTAIVSSIYGVAHLYLPAAIAVVLGVVWLILEISHKQALPSLFLLSYVALVIWGCLHDMSFPAMLLSLCATLAAWDLSRFRARATQEAEDVIDPFLETSHLQKLAMTAGAGFVTALLPSLIRVPITLSFVVFVMIALLAMLVLRQAALSLRNP